MAALKNWVKESRFAIGLLMVQMIATGLQLLSKVILNEGSFVFAFMAYRHIVGAVCVGPFAFFLEKRGRGLHKLSLGAFFWLFVVALTGVSMAMGLFYYGLRDTTATYATKFLNIVPIITFLFSIILRLEKLQLHSSAGKIKGLGAILCLCGAVTIALYKGKSFHISHPILHHSRMIHKKAVKHWTQGTIFLVCCVLCYGFWFMTQVKLFKIFPYKFWATFYICIIATVQLVAIGLCIDRRKVAWHLAWNLQLITIFYAGTLATAATFCLISWAVAERGPTYPSLFNPLSLIFVATTEALVLGEPITVGSLIGRVLIVIGFFSFLWSKNREIESKKALPVGETDIKQDKVSTPAADRNSNDSIVCSK